LWDSSIPKAPKGLLELNVQDASQSQGFQSACLAQDGNNLLVRYAAKMQPKIEKVSFLSNDNQIKNHIVLTRFLMDATQPKKVTSNSSDNRKLNHLKKPRLPMQTRFMR
jgi:hypothetical protein